MAATEDTLETYTHLPLHLDPSTKLITTTTSNPSKSDSNLLQTITNINALHNQFKSLDTANHAPPPPLPVAPKRTAQLTKMREAAAAAVRKNQFSDAIKYYSLAIDMAASRPPWEPVGLVREELALCYMERANVYVLMREWAEGWVDAQCSADCKRGVQQGPQGQKVQGNPRAFVLGGKCLVEMARWEEGIEWLEKGIELEGDEGMDGKEMLRLLAEARSGLERNAARP